MLITAILLDTVVLGVFGVLKVESDPFIIVVAIVAMAAVFVFERVYLSRWTAMEERHGHGDH